MTPAARAFIVRCFCRNCSAGQTAYCVNEMFKLDHKVTTETVNRIWDQERSCNVVIRDLEAKLGERPRKGYVPCEHARMAEGLVAG